MSGPFIAKLLIVFCPAVVLAQEPLRVPLASTFGPVRMVPGQTLHVCVNHLYNNALVSSQISTAPLPVRVAFLDAVNGRLYDKPKEMSLNILKGECQDMAAPETQAESHILAIVIPISQQNAKQANTDILPICSATLLDGSGPQARTVSSIPMVPKINLLLPRPGQ